LKNGPSENGKDIVLRAEQHDKQRDDRGAISAAQKQETPGDAGVSVQHCSSCCLRLSLTRRAAARPAVLSS
jgi:hypothetical protein